MSDKPLFEDMDEQEQELGVDPSDIAAEDAAIAYTAGVVGPGSGTNPSAPGAAAGVGPAIGATALANEMEDDDDEVPAD